MGISISHSSSPNWHLTAAPHGLLAGSVSAPLFFFYFFFLGVGRSSAASDITQLRGHFLLHSLLPTLHHSLPSQLSCAGRSLHPQTAPSAHYRFSQSPCRSEIHPSSPLYSSRVSTFSLLLWLPHPNPLQWRKQHEDVLQPGSEPKRDSAQGRHMATFSKSYLYLTRSINQKQISSSAVICWAKRRV